jgi:hypothetical protein
LSSSCVFFGSGSSSLPGSHSFHSSSFSSAFPFSSSSSFPSTTPGSNFLFGAGFRLRFGLVA